jgi:1,4-dihydroxy-2-naphthoate polyprenyltransferase
MGMQNKKRSKFSIWLQATRVFSLTASAIPVILGSALAFSFPGKVDWFLLPVIFIAGVLLHAGINMIGDYFDYKNGIDKDYAYASSKVIVDGLLTPKATYIGGIILFVIVFILGMFLVYFRGYPMLALGFVGMLAGYFYCANPIGYKYFALGDFSVFIMFGPLMVLGTYFGLTGYMDWITLIIAIPIGFLTTSILHANNTRDIAHDTSENIKTVASILGYERAKYEYYFLIVGAYLGVVIMILLKLLPLWSLLVFLSIPPAVKNMQKIKSNTTEDVKGIAMLDVQSAQVHLLFGLLLSVSLFLYKVII